MNINETLKEFGLSEKEAIIYVTLLQIGNGSILDISKHCSLKRPTIYNSIESLEAQGLVHRTLKGKRVRFSAESPNALLALQKKRERQLEDLLPQLEAMEYVPRGTKPETRFYEGKKGVTQHYISLFSQLQEKDDIYFITSMRDLLQNFREMVETFNTQAEKWNLRVKELMPDNEASKKYIEEMPGSVKKNRNHQVKILPKGLDLFDTEVLITANSISLLSLQKDIFAITIQSPHLVASFQTIFKALWMSATELK